VTPPFHLLLTSPSLRARPAAPHPPFWQHYTPHSMQCLRNRTRQRPLGRARTWLRSAQGLQRHAPTQPHSFGDCACFQRTLHRRSGGSESHRSPDEFIRAAVYALQIGNGMILMAARKSRQHIAFSNSRKLHAAAIPQAPDDGRATHLRPCTPPCHRCKAKRCATHFARAPSKKIAVFFPKQLDETRPKKDWRNHRRRCPLEPPLS
jgi:hypothetical protein